MSILWLRQFHSSAKWVLCLAVLCAASVWEGFAVNAEALVLPDMVLNQLPMFAYITPIFIVLTVSLLGVFDKSYVIVRYKNARGMGAAMQMQILLTSIAYASFINLWMVGFAWVSNTLQNSYYSVSIHYLQILYLVLRFIFFAELALLCKKLLKKNVFVFAALYGMITTDFILFMFGITNRTYITPGITAYENYGGRYFLFEVALYAIGAAVLAAISTLYTCRSDLYAGEWND